MCKQDTSNQQARPPPFEQQRQQLQLELLAVGGISSVLVVGGTSSVPAADVFSAAAAGELHQWHVFVASPLQALDNSPDHVVD